jgi:predicted site-specific integrase-resolvase
MNLRWVSAKEAAEGAGVDEKTIRRWAIAGKVRARLLPSGARWRIAVDREGFPLRA